MVIALAVVTALVALTNWYAVATSRARLEWWTKLLTMVALIATALAAGAASTGTGGWLLVALCLGLLGDFALLGSSNRRFVGGVFAFLVGHVAYVVCFARLGLPAPGWWWVVVALVIGMAAVTRDLVPTAWRLAGPTFAVPIAVYSLVIAAMLVVAWLTGVGLVAVGATIFVVSDALIALTLARTELGRPHGRTQLAVMVTYHVGQALIVAGVLSQI